MPRLRDPIPAGRSRRIGAAAIASLAVHGSLAAALTSAAFSLARPATPAIGQISDVEMSLSAQAPSPVLKVIAPAPVPNLDRLLDTPRTPAAAAAQPDEVDAGDLNQVLSQADTAANGGQPAAAATTSGAAAALERTPSAASVAFAGLSAQGDQARTVVYVIDASGPMISSLSDVLAEVNRSVASLLPTQRFGVVLFRQQGNDSGTERFSSQLLEASPRNRELLRRWLGTVTAGGRSNPMDGLRAGLSMRPQVIFLLSRSITRTGGGDWDLGPQATLAELERLNPPLVQPQPGQPAPRATTIKTIQFQEPDPTGIMQQIALRHGGQSAGTPGPAYRVLKREELQKR